MADLDLEGCLWFMRTVSVSVGGVVSLIPESLDKILNGVVSDAQISVNIANSTVCALHLVVVVI